MAGVTKGWMGPEGQITIGAAAVLVRICPGLAIHYIEGKRLNLICLFVNGLGGQY